MNDFGKLEQQLAATLRLRRRPVAITFHDRVPEGVAKFEGCVPSGCTFWKLAAEGRTFYTIPADHYNCPIGSFTHNMPLPAGREAELGQTLSLMEQIGYVRMEEVPNIPRLDISPAAVVYRPLADARENPDVVVISGRPGAMMLLQEAAIRARIAAQLNTLGRPTCMGIPAAKALGMVASTACIGNRVYNALDDADMYVMVPGSSLMTLVAELATVHAANETLRQYHTDRREKLLHIE